MEYKNVYLKLLDVTYRIRGKYMDRVVVYGMGKFYKEFCEQIDESYEIVAYVDRNPNANNIYSDIKSVPVMYDKVLIMVENISACFNIANRLLDENIQCNDIILGISKWGQYSDLDKIEVTAEGKFLIGYNDLFICVRNEDEFQNVIDTIYMECYCYKIKSDREIVLDVGMNVGDSAVFFARNEKVVAVYGYEPFMETYISAVDNVKRNKVENKTHMHSFGLSDHDEKKIVDFNSDMSCGQSSINEINTEIIESYRDWGIINNEGTKKEQIEIKKSSDVISEIYREWNKDVTYVLKLDCEGEEFAILKDLSENNLLKLFSFIMMEWHYKEADPLLTVLELNGFSYYKVKKSIKPELGLIYAWK